jgi:hypothetical protein
VFVPAFVCCGLACIATRGIEASCIIDDSLVVSLSEIARFTRYNTLRNNLRVILVV